MILDSGLYLEFQMDTIALCLMEPKQSMFNKWTSQENSLWWYDLGFFLSIISSENVVLNNEFCKQHLEIHIQNPFPSAI